MFFIGRRTSSFFSLFFLISILTLRSKFNVGSISNIFNNVNLSEEIAMNEEEEDDSSLDGWEDETIE